MGWTIGRIKGIWGFDGMELGSDSGDHDLAFAFPLTYADGWMSKVRRSALMDLHFMGTLSVHVRKVEMFHICHDIQ